MEANIQNIDEAKILDDWRGDLKTIKQDLGGLFIVRTAFEKLRKVVLAVEGIPPKDKAFASSFNVFTNLVLQGYVAFIAMGIRRHIKSDDSSISLLGLLEKIKKNSKYISKSYFISLYHCEDIEPEGSMVNEEDFSDEEKKAIDNQAKNETKERCKKRAEKDWEELVGKGSDESLLPEVIEEDICELECSAKNIEYFADKYIAHLDENRKPPDLTLEKIDKSLSKIEEIYKKYSRLLTGSALDLSKPVPQFNDKEFFDEFEKWLVEKLGKKTTE
jgi:hypothetical protein